MDIVAVVEKLNPNHTDGSNNHRSDELSDVSAQSASKPPFLFFCLPIWFPGRNEESSSSSSRIVGIDEGKSIRDTGGCGCGPWVGFMEVDGRAFLLDEVEEAVADPAVVSSLSRNSKAVMKT